MVIYNQSFLHSCRNHMRVRFQIVVRNILILVLCGNIWRIMDLMERFLKRRLAKYLFLTIWILNANASILLQSRARYYTEPYYSPSIPCDSSLNSSYSCSSSYNSSLSNNFSNSQSWNAVSPPFDPTVLPPIISNSYTQSCIEQQLHLSHMNVKQMRPLSMANSFDSARNNAGNNGYNIGRVNPNERHQRTTQHLANILANTSIQGLTGEHMARLLESW